MPPVRAKAFPQAYLSIMTNRRDWQLVWIVLLAAACYAAFWNRTAIVSWAHAVLFSKPWRF